MIDTQCVFANAKKEVLMDFKERVISLRESTGMTRKEFCEYFNIPYRTMTEWERDNRHAPEYVLRLLEYYIRREGLVKDKKEENK
jgi:DNA-binding transcriptional regulator YiaG